MKEKEEEVLMLVEQLSVKSCDISSGDDIDGLISIVTELKTILKNEIDPLRETLSSQELRENLDKLEEDMKDLDKDSPVRVVVNRTKKVTEDLEERYNRYKKIFDELEYLEKSLQTLKPLYDISYRYSGIDISKEIEEACKDLADRLKISFAVES